MAETGILQKPTSHLAPLKRVLLFLSGVWTKIENFRFICLARAKSKPSEDGHLRNQMKRAGLEEVYLPSQTTGRLVSVAVLMRP